MTGIEGVKGEALRVRVVLHPDRVAETRQGGGWARRRVFPTAAESRVYLTLDDGTEVDLTEEVQAFELMGRGGHGPLSVRLTLDAEIDLVSKE